MRVVVAFAIRNHSLAGRAARLCRQLRLLLSSSSSTTTISQCNHRHAQHEPAPFFSASPLSSPNSRGTRKSSCSQDYIVLYKCDCVHCRRYRDHVIYITLGCIDGDRWHEGTFHAQREAMTDAAVGDCNDRSSACHQFGLPFELGRFGPHTATLSKFASM